MRTVLFWIIILLPIFPLEGQVITFNTPFPTPDQEITLFFDATQGNRGLENCACDVYLHTGVTPAGGDDWQYVQGDWGKAIPRLRMTRVDDNTYSFTMTIREYYNLPEDLKVEKLSFVFRNADGSRAGRTLDGSDIFVDIFDADAPLLTSLVEPFDDVVYIRPETSVPIEGYASKPSTLRLEENGQIITQTDAGQTELIYSYDPNIASGNFDIQFIAREDETGIEDTSSFILSVIPFPGIQDPPAGTELGLTREADGTFTLMLEAPGKESVILLENGNDFLPTVSGVMSKSTDGRYFWINYEPNREHDWFIYQYLVDEEILVADPFSTTVLDPDHDGFISSRVNDDFPDYPEGGVGILSYVPMEEEPYEWEVEEFTPPADEDLLIYELHLRDFLQTSSYRVLVDTLDYLQNLGINAIELMPVSEFEGNDSWGYNPSFHMALDKYYGSPEDFKRFVDEAHKRGMAVFLDVVYNHVFSLSPLARLYWDPVNFRPAADNPWLNVTPRHPFNVGYDVDHQSQATKRWLARINRFWLEEYRVDGFRFDLSKGFTQVNNPDDVGAWGQYDATRVALWKEIGDMIWSINSDAVLMLEHFADNDEETELANYGFLFWGNLNFNYNEGTMGYTENRKSDLSWGLYQERGWNDPHLVTYMESHDEERLMHKNRQFGNSQGDYNTRISSVALDRMELAHTFFWTIPGPKMIWQFGELGYDLSINYCIQNGTINEDCRTGRKPVRWFYYNIPDRRDLYNYISDLTWLRTHYPAPFRDTEPDYQLSGAVKTIFLDSDALDIRAVGNFAVEPQTYTASFPADGIWYNYVNGDSLQVSGGSHTFQLAPGEYALWLSQKVDRPNPPDRTTSTGYVAPELKQFTVYPNPASSSADLYLRWSGLDEQAFILQLTNLQGQTVWQQQMDGVLGGVEVTLPSLPEGLYSMQLRRPNGQLLGVEKVVIRR